LKTIDINSTNKMNSLDSLSSTSD